MKKPLELQNALKAFRATENNATWVLKWARNRYDTALGSAGKTEDNLLYGAVWFAAWLVMGKGSRGVPVSGLGALLSPESTSGRSCRIDKALWSEHSGGGLWSTCCCQVDFGIQRAMAITR